MNTSAGLCYHYRVYFSSSYKLTLLMMIAVMMLFPIFLRLGISGMICIQRHAGVVRNVFIQRLLKFFIYVAFLRLMMQRLSLRLRFLFLLDVFLHLCVANSVTGQ